MDAYYYCKACDRLTEVSAAARSYWFSNLWQLPNRCVSLGGLLERAGVCCGNPQIVHCRPGEVIQRKDIRNILEHELARQEKGGVSHGET